MIFILILCLEGCIVVNPVLQICPIFCDIYLYSVCGEVGTIFAWFHPVFFYFKSVQAGSTREHHCLIFLCE